MNTVPMLWGKQIATDGCGFEAMRTTAVTFWQSRLTTAGNRAEPPEIIDIPTLAGEIRRSWP